VKTGYKQVRFTAGLKYNENQELYRTSAQPDYLASPSKEVDAAWEQLIGGMYPAWSNGMIQKLMARYRGQHFYSSR